VAGVADAAGDRSGEFEGRVGAGDGGQSGSGDDGAGEVGGELWRIRNSRGVLRCFSSRDVVFVGSLAVVFVPLLGIGVALCFRQSVIF
jgi:hypothetical protein